MMSTAEFYFVMISFLAFIVFWILIGLLFSKTEKKDRHIQMIECQHCTQIFKWDVTSFRPLKCYFCNKKAEVK